MLQCRRLAGRAPTLAGGRRHRAEGRPDVGAPDLAGETPALAGYSRRVALIVKECSRRHVAALLVWPEAKLAAGGRLVAAAPRRRARRLRRQQQPAALGRGRPAGAGSRRRGPAAGSVDHSAMFAPRYRPRRNCWPRQARRGFRWHAGWPTAAAPPSWRRCGRVDHCFYDLDAPRRAVAARPSAASPRSPSARAE